MKRLLTAILILAILCSLFVPAASAKDRYEVPLPFKDVKGSHWFYFDVCYVYDKGLMNGVSETSFAPNASASRAMIATIFWRMQGCPEPASASTFVDVPENAWFAKSVAWMQEVGLTTGSGHNKFSPNKSITREELATFFYRYAQTFCNMFNPIYGDVSSFADSANISAWATETMQWVVGEHIIEGVGNNLLAPRKTATRAEIAAILYRFIEIDFSQKRLIKIEATGDPEKLMVPLNCQSIIYWEAVIVTGYYNDGSVEIIPRQGEVSWVGSSGGVYDTSKVGVTQLLISVDNCSCYIDITVVEALPYTPIDIKAAMEFGNEYAKSLGFEIDYSLAVETAGYNFPSAYSIGYMNTYGGQTALINRVKDYIDYFKEQNDYYVQAYGENQRIKYIRCYIEFVEEYEGNTYNQYWIYVLY